jgi:hypothetical protein
LCWKEGKSLREGRVNLDWEKERRKFFEDRNRNKGNV